jgi:plastocyanin
MIKRKTLGLLALATAASALVAIPAGALGGASAASTHTVTLSGFRFHPSTLKINRGDRVTWLWRQSGVEHNVTFHGVHSHTQVTGSYTVRFTRAGTYNYRCTIHAEEGMRAKIIVH